MNNQIFYTPGNTSPSGIFLLAGSSDELGSHLVSPRASVNNTPGLY